MTAGKFDWLYKEKAAAGKVSRCDGIFPPARLFLAQPAAAGRAKTHRPALLAGVGEMDGCGGEFFEEEEEEVNGWDG